jgi:hypothetical protein
MRSVLIETVQAVSGPVTILSYASMRLRYHGEAPRKPFELACCIRLLNDHPWMREPAFEFLSNLKNSDWPYLIAAWDDLAAVVRSEVGDIEDARPDCYAPKTSVRMRAVMARRCDKPHCSHSVEQHDNGAHCMVLGCNCGYFLKKS